MPPSRRPVRLADLERVRSVRDRMDREFATRLDVATLAEDVNMSAAHLSRLFRRVYAESPYQYLMTRRLERAMMLLRRGDMSITDICFEVGFSSLGSFSSRFSEVVGVSPRVYRERADVPEGLAACVARSVTRPIRNREAHTQTSI